MSEPKYVAETLAWCNERRKERRKRALNKLPRGVIGDPLSCPCGKATGLSVYRDEAYDETRGASGEVVGVPTAVTRFVDAFDAGRLPQYEVKS